MAFSISGLAGADINSTSTDKKFAIGTIALTSDGGQAIYVSATSTISTYNAVVIDEKGGAVPVTTTNSAVSKRLAFAQTSIASGYNGWVVTGGKVLVTLATNCAPSVPLYTTATAGVLDDAVVSGGLAIGIVATNTISNATAVTCIAAIGTMIGTGDMD